MKRITTSPDGEFTSPTDMKWIAGSDLLMGSEEFYPEERPVRTIAVDGFWMDVSPVTNASFERFIRETGYVTVAEKFPSPEDYPGIDPALLVPGSLVFKSPEPETVVNHPGDWWFYVPGACWHKPDGIHALSQADAGKPVVQVCYEDALAYAAWSGKSLPTEAEWELAARGGLRGKDYAWGDAFIPEGKRLANTWEGNFPFKDEHNASAFFGTSPVGVYPANPFGLLDVIGNVWEWTLDEWTRHHHPVKKSCCSPKQPGPQVMQRVLKGGSHLCAPNYCQRYRPAARIAQMEDSATSHIGFRCVRRQT